MRNDTVLVEVWIPAAYFKKDMILPMDMPIYLIMRLLDHMLQELVPFSIQPETGIYRKKPFEEFLPNATLRDYQVMNAETFILL